jgi:hypothetical protein
MIEERIHKRCAAARMIQLAQIAGYLLFRACYLKRLNRSEDFA